MLQNFPAFLKARLAERSSRIQLVMLVLMGLVLTGVVTMDQLQGYADKLMPMLALMPVFLGLIVPDKNHAIVAAADQDAAVKAALDAATEAAEKAAGPKATQVAQSVGAVFDKLGL